MTYPHTEGTKDLDLPLTLVEGANKFELSWNTQAYDSLQLDRVEVVHS